MSNPTTTARESLKPCPFCNGPATLERLAEFNSWGVRCINPGCVIGPFWSHPDEAKVVRVWNTRALANEPGEVEQYAVAKREALNLATSIWRSEFRDTAPNWEPLDTVAGIISQIDNMYAGVRAQRDGAVEAVEKLKAAHHSYIHRIRDMLGMKTPGDGFINFLEAMKEDLERLRRSSLPAAPGATQSSERTDGERKYYLMENREGRRWVGNSAVWWGPGNAGYTCNLDQAGVYTEEQIAEHRKCPDCIVVVPVEVAQSVQHTHADHNAVKDALRAAMQAEGGEG